MKRASLDDLAAFARVARLRSFTRAAAELGTSTSNLSHTIRRLEQRLGARLLQRTSRSVAPSKAGEDLLASLEPALTSIDDALDGLDRGLRGVTGTLRLTATRQAYESVVKPLLPAFVAANPDAGVEVTVEYGFSDIVAEQYDAGIRLGEKVAWDMIAVRIGPAMRMAVVASPAYLAQHGTPQHPRDLARHRGINYRMATAGTIYAWEFERDGVQLEVQVPGPLAFNDPGPMLDCAVRGLGIAYLVEDDVAAHVAEGTLVRLFPDWTPAFPGYHLYYPSRRQMRPVLTAFLNLARHRAALPPR